MAIGQQQEEHPVQVVAHLRRRRGHHHRNAQHMMQVTVRSLAVCIALASAAAPRSPDIVLVHLPQRHTSHLPPSINIAARFAIPIEVEMALAADAASPELAGVLDSVRVVSPADILSDSDLFDPLQHDPTGDTTPRPLRPARL